MCVVIHGNCLGRDSNAQRLHIRASCTSYMSAPLLITMLFCHWICTGSLLLRTDASSSVNICNASNDSAQRYICLQKWKSALSLTSKADVDLSLKYVTADRTISKMKGKQKKPFGELLVTVKMARNLSAIRGNNLSNPFCKWQTLFLSSKAKLLANYRS